MKGGFGDAKTISVSVLERSSDSWLQTVTISAGKKQGVEKNMLVATSDGAIGLVESVQTMTSTVQLLTSQHLSNDIAITLEKIYNIVDSRYRKQKPMIFTTNLTVAEMQEETDVRYSRIYDRVFEVCYPMQFIGQSWRMKTASRRFDEMEQLLNGE